MRLIILITLMVSLSACGVTPIKDKQLIPIDHSNIEYAYIAKAPPTVVFLSGWGVTLDHWRPVYREIAKTNSVFAYNRFGYGNSAERDEVQSGQVIVDHLHSLLTKKRIEPPYILVAHSIGGLYANLYARRYPDEIAGVVFVDASHPQQRERFEEVGVKEGLFSKILLSGLKTFFPTMYTEVDGFQTTADQIFWAGPFPPVPVTVITAGETAAMDKAGPVWDTLQKNLANLSPKGQQIIAKESSHNIMKDAPEIIIKAIREMAATGTGQR